MFAECKYTGYMIDITKEIKDELRQIIRTQKGLNQKVVASKVGIGQSALSQILTGQRKGSFELLYKIAEACGTTIGTIEKKLQASAPINNAVRETPGIYQNSKVIPAFNGSKMTHEDVIGQFSDKEQAKMVNFMLVEIEKTDPKRYGDVCDYIKTMYRKVSEQKKPKKKAGNG